jgi:hypothetical protein
MRINVRAIIKYLFVGRYPRNVAKFVKRIPPMAMLALTFTALCSFTDNPAKVSSAEYSVKRLKRSIKIDGNWEKSAWRKISEIPIGNYMGQIPAFKPLVKAKMMYDKDNLYLIYKVEDRHVRIQNDKFNGPVSHDACVEFFFSPDTEWPLRYFNLEINAGGTALMAFHQDGKRVNMVEDDFKNVEIAHTLPRKVDQEISEPVTWFIEVKLPLVLLKKYSSISQPKKGVTWKANFYKTSSRSTNPHYITWSVVNNPVPQFHLPQFFGTLRFQ